MIKYSTSLTNSQWQCIKKFLNDNRKRRIHLRRVWNAILYQLKTGCQWRMLPNIVVDTLGMLMCVVVTAANVHDSVAAERVIKRMSGTFPRLKKLLADGGYAGERLVALARSELNAHFEVVTRSDEVGFKVIPKRWIVERSISWFMWSRRLCKDYEANMESSEGWIIVASIAMMIKKI